MHHNTLQCIIRHHSASQRITAHQKTPQGITRHLTVHYKTSQCTTAQYNTVQCTKSVQRDFRGVHLAACGRMFPLLSRGNRPYICIQHTHGQRPTIVPSVPETGPIYVNQPPATRGSKPESERTHRYREKRDEKSKVPRQRGRILTFPWKSTEEERTRIATLIYETNGRTNGHRSN